MELLHRAERHPVTGRIAGEGPPRLVPLIARRLSAQEIAKVQEMQDKSAALRREQVLLFQSLGLDPRKRYRFTLEGDIAEIGSNRAVY